MATWTSQRAGDWSRDAANADSPWNGGGNPASGYPSSADQAETVNINHKVKFDIDMSARTNGITLVINSGSPNTGILWGTTTANSYLKCAANITCLADGGIIRASGDGNAGSNSNRFPLTYQFTIDLGSYYIDCNTNNYLSLDLWCSEPTDVYAYLLAAGSDSSGVRNLITAITQDDTTFTVTTNTNHGFAANADIVLLGIGTDHPLNGVPVQVRDVTVGGDAKKFTVKWPYSGSPVVRYCTTLGWPTPSVGANSYVNKLAAYVSGDSVVYVDRDVSASGSNWTGDAHFAQPNKASSSWQSLTKTISSTTSTSITLGATLGQTLYAGSIVAVRNRNVKITGTNASYLIRYIKGGSQLDACLHAQSAASAMISTSSGTGTSPMGISKGFFYSGITSSSMSASLNISGGVFHLANVFVPSSYAFTATISGGVFAGCNSVVSGQAPASVVSGGLFVGCVQPIACQTIISGGRFVGCGGVTLSSSVVTGGKFLYCTSAVGILTRFVDGEVYGCGYFVYGSTGTSYDSVVLGGKVVGCTVAIFRSTSGVIGTIKIRGGTFYDSVASVYTNTSVDLLGINLNSVAETVGWSGTYYPEYVPQLGTEMVSRNHNGTANSLRVYGTSGTVDDNDLAGSGDLTPLRAYTFTPQYWPYYQSPNLWYFDNFILQVGQTLTVTWKAKKSSTVTWSQLPILEIYDEDELPPVFGGTALVSQAISNNTDVQSFTTTYTESTKARKVRAQWRMSIPANASSAGSCKLGWSYAVSSGSGSGGQAMFGGLLNG